MMCPACAAGMSTSLYNPHEITYEGKKGWINCGGTACQICRTITQTKSLKLISEIIRTLFGKKP